MGAELSLDPEHVEPILVIAVVTVAYVAFHYLASAKRALGGATEPRSGEAFERLRARAIFRQRLLGAVLLGVVPALIGLLGLGLGPRELGLVPRDPVAGLGWAIGLAIIAVGAAASNARRPSAWEHYPELRLPVWDRSTTRDNALTWIVYLLGYELFFRGFFLFAMVRWVGVWPGIAVVTLAYVFAHLPKNGAETAGTIPMGVLFALAALAGGIWAPFFAHSAVAIASDHLVLRARARAGAR